MANQKAIEKKQSEVSALAEKMKESKLVLLTDYRGISVEDVTGLRSNLRKVDNYIERRTGLTSSTMSGTNNNTVNGSGQNIINSIINDKIK